MSRRLWIAVEAHLVKRYIAFQAAEVLGVKRVTAVGHLVSLWGEVAEDAHGGDLSEVLDAQLEDWGLWEGEPGRFAAFIREHCVTDGVLNGWDEMQGPMERRRAVDRGRLQRWRAAQKRNAVGDTGGNVSETLRNGATRQDKTVPKEQLQPPAPKKPARKPAEPKVLAPRPKHWAQPLADAWDAKFGAGSFAWPKHARALAALGELSSEDAAALGASFARYLGETEPRYASLPAFLAKRLSYLEPQPSGEDRDVAYAEAHGGIWDTARGQLTDAGDLITNPDREQERARKVGAWRG